MSKHTPGPWTKNRYGELVGSDGSLVSVKSLGLSMVCGGGDEQVYPTEFANARLIAAAPMLLETLQFIQDHGYVNGSDWNRVQAAIDAATGETP